MLKKALTIIAGAAAVSVIAGCSAGAGGTSTSEQETTTQDPGLTSSEETAGEFLKCIDKGEYIKALEFCTDSVQSSLDWKDMISKSSESAIQEAVDGEDINISDETKKAAEDFFVKVLDAAVEKYEITGVEKEDEAYKISFELTEHDMEDDSSESDNEKMEEILNDYYSANQEKLDGYIRSGDQNAFYNELLSNTFSVYADSVSESIKNVEPTVESYWLKVSETEDGYKVSDIDMSFKLMRATVDASM